MKKILVVDDDEITLNLIDHLLKTRDYKIITAKNGIEGIRKALSFHPDLMTIDVMMPKLNGVNMMKILTLMRFQIPAIFVTIKSGIKKYADQFPNIKGICLKKELTENLARMIDETIARGNRGYTDIKYPLKENEIFGLLGKSDRKKILIVSDLDTLDLVTVMLGNVDIYELYHTSDGQEAIFKATVIKPDLILSDIDIPNIDGIMLAKILFILGHPIPLVFLSDKNDIQTIKEASTLEGIRGYLLKREVKHNDNLLKERIEQILDISHEEKIALRASYKAADIEKIGDFESESNIWVSLDQPAQ